MKRAGITYKEKENRLHPEISRWFVIYPKYKTEKHVSNNLTKKGISCYVPLIDYSKQYGRKIKRYSVPLINCYVFVKITKGEYLRVLETEYVSGFLKIKGNLCDVKDHEIDLLRRIVGQNDAINAETISFEAGKRVEIISGNLTGVKGVLVNKAGKNEFIVELESIGYQFRMSINKELLRALF